MKTFKEQSRTFRVHQFKISSNLFGLGHHLCAEKPAQAVLTAETTGSIGTFSLLRPLLRTVIKIISEQIDVTLMNDPHLFLNLLQQL